MRFPHSFVKVIAASDNVFRALPHFNQELHP